MSCTYTIDGKTYSAWEFDDYLRSLPADELAKYEPKVAAKFSPKLYEVPTQGKAEIEQHLSGNAEAMPKPVESFEAFRALFKSYPVVTTPVGDVKLGENQWAKLTGRERLMFSGMIKPTLENPLYVVREPNGADVFIKSFSNYKDQTKLFVSVTREFDDVKVSFSNHLKGLNKVVKIIESGELLNMQRPVERSANPESTQQLDQSAIGLNKNVSEQAKTVKRSVAAQTLIDTIEGRLEKIDNRGRAMVERHLDNLKRGLAGEVVRDEQGNLLAPNGKKSKLDEKQYMQVRSPEFIAWFGDWLSFHNAKDGAGVWHDDDAQTVSKVVDENGEPAVAYHGAERGGFTKLDPAKADGHRSPMIFAAASRETSRSYSGRGDEIDLNPIEVKPWKGEFGLFAYGAELPFEIHNTRKEAEEYREHNRPTQRGVYSIFLNIRNPQEAHFEGANWDGQAPPNAYEVFDGTGDQVFADDGSRYFGLEHAQDKAAEVDGDYRDATDHYETTNSVAEEALKYGHDGAIIRDVVDDGGKTGGIGADTIFVIFDSNQAKSATQNTGAFSKSNDDLRYSPTISDFKASLPKRIDNLIYEAQDKLIDLKRIRDTIKASGVVVREQYDAYLAEELFHGRAAYRVQTSFENEFLPLLEEMKMRGIDVEDFDKFLHARHAKERNAAMLKANPNQAELDQQIKDTADAVLRASGRDAVILEAKLRSLLATKPYSGTEAERAKLSGMSDAEADAVLAGLGNRRAAFDALGAKVDALVEETRLLLEVYGLEKSETVDALRNAYRHYVPLMREMDESDLLGSGGSGTGAGYSTRGSTLKSATGSLRKVESIFANLMAQREQVIVRGEKAMVGKSLYGMVLSAPNPDLWIAIRPDMSQKQLTDSMRRAGMDPSLIAAMAHAPTEAYVDPKTGIVRHRINPLIAKDPMALVVRIGGEDRVILFNKENDQAARLALSLKNLDVTQPVGWASGITSAAGMVTRWISSVNTQYNPIFGLKNFLRDAQGAFFNLATTPIADKNAAVMGGIKAALATVFADERGWAVKDPTWQKYWKEFEESGATTGYRDQFNGIESRVKHIQGLVKPGKMSKLADRTGAKYVLDLLSDYNTAIESGVRLSAYRVARENGMSKAQAASLAKNLTVNFNRKGRSGRSMSSWYAFWNAAVQGNARILETAQGGHKGAAAAHYATKFLMGGASLGFMAAMIALMFMGDDYDDIPEFIRERDIIIPIGKMDIEGAKTTKAGTKYLHIPMALGFHAIAGIGRTAAELAYFQDKPGKRIGKVFLSIIDAFNPMGSSNSMLEMLAPSFMDPMIQLYGNQNAFGRPIAKQNFSDKDPTPAPDRFFRSASSVGKVISKGLDRMSGGDGVDPGAIQVTPDQVDFVFGNITGGVGRESLKLYQWLESKVTGDKIPESRVPIKGMFYGETKSEQNTIGKFMELERAVNIAVGQLEARESEAAKQQLIKDKPEAVIAPQMKAAIRRLNRLSKIRKQADARGDKEELARLDSEANDIRSGMLDIYDTARNSKP